MFQHSYILGVDRKRLGMQPENVRRNPYALAEAEMLLVQVEADICRALGQLGINYKSSLDGIIQTTMPIDPNTPQGARALGQMEGIADRLGVPLKVEYRGQRLI